MKRQLRILEFALAVISILFISAGCKKDSSSPTAPVSTGNDISIQNMAFSPASKTIKQGVALKWTNNDNIPHTVTSGVPGSPDGNFDSGTLAKGATFSHTFSIVGTFKYYCTIHGASMTGTVIVDSSTTTVSGGGGGGGYVYP